MWLLVIIFGLAAVIPGVLNMVGAIRAFPRLLAILTVGQQYLDAIHQGLRCFPDSVSLHTEYFLYSRTDSPVGLFSSYNYAEILLHFHPCLDPSLLQPIDVRMSQ